MRLVFDDQHTATITTDRLIRLLCSLPDGTWTEYRNASAITPAQVAAILRPFEVRPKKWREGKLIVRGYHRHDFADAWTRWAPSALNSEPPHRPEGATPATPATKPTTDSERATTSPTVAAVAPVAAPKERVQIRRPGERLANPAIARALAEVRRTRDHADPAGSEGSDRGDR